VLLRQNDKNQQINHLGGRMIKKSFATGAAIVLMTAAAMAQEVPQASAPAYNCDYQPACEVAPGFYGKISAPVTSKFNLGIGGFIKLDYAHNSVNLGDRGALGTLQPNIPKSSSRADDQDQSIFTARQSRFWLKVSGPTFLGAKTNGIIEADFYGAGGASNETSNMRLRLANASLDWAKTQVVFGQAYDIFGPAVASTIDFGSGAHFGNPNNPRVPQLRVTRRVELNENNTLRFVAGVQNPTQDSNLRDGTAKDSWGDMVNVAGQVMLLSKALGVAPGYYGLSMNPLTAGFFGLYGEQEVGPANDEIDSWGYGFYTFVPLIPSRDGRDRAMTLSYEGQAYLAANLSANAATAGTAVGPEGDKSPAKGFGFYSQLIFYPTQNLGITAGYGRRSVYDHDSYRETPGLTNYEKSNSHLYMNVAYDLNAAIRVAAEYQKLSTEYGNVKDVPGGNLAGLADSGRADIIRLAAYYFF
jgi:hypothetical protein